MIAVIESARASADSGSCGTCSEPFSPGQRIILIRLGAEHQWIHVRHIAEIARNGQPGPATGEPKLPRGMTHDHQHDREA